MQRSVHRLHTLQDCFFFKLSAFRQQHLVCPEHFWLSQKIEDTPGKRGVCLGPSRYFQIISSDIITTAPHPIIFSCTQALSPCFNILHQFTMSHHSWIISNHVRRLPRNLQEHIILNPSHLHDGLVISGNLSLVGGLQDSHQESKPCKPPGPTTRPNHQLIIGWQITVPRYLLHLMFEWPQFVFKSKEPSNHLISSRLISCP